MKNKVPQYKINSGKLELAKGELAAKLGNSLEWKEFAKMVGVSNTTISNIINGRTNGSIPTAEKITKLLREHGVPWTLEDLTS